MSQTLGKNNNADNAGNKAVGKSINRVDGRLKVTGAARYSAEIPVENIAYGVIIGSTIARGSIKSIDTRAAESSPGVLAILTHLNAPKLRPMPGFLAGGAAAESRIPLQDTLIYHSGQPIGVVIADTFERATHAATLVRVTYEEQPPVIESVSNGNSLVAYPTLCPVLKPSRWGDLPA